MVDGFGWECVSFESLIVGLKMILFPRLTDGEFRFNKGVLDGFLIIVPSAVVDVNFLIGNEGLSGTTKGFGIVKRSGGGGPCCWSLSLFS